jgi:biopolymer transport protein ExbD
MGLIAARQDDQVMAEINVTPFTDVLLVLLIVFMILAALTTPPGFQKELANKAAPSQRHQSDSKKIIDVEVNGKGVIFIDGRKTDDVGVYALMESVERTRGRLHVSITADAKTPYQIIMRILDAAKIADLDDVGFATS